MRIAAIQAGIHLPNWELHVKREAGVLNVLTNKQYVPEKVSRPAQHRHDYGQNQMPVLSFDLHKTLTPDWGYPLISPPFPGVKAFLDQQVSRGCCIHISTASIDHSDPDMNAARTKLVWGFVNQNGLPVSWVGPNSDAALRIDDRAVNIPPIPDWFKSLPGQFQALLNTTYRLDDSGLYCRRDDLQPVGDVIDPDTGYPDDKDVPQDAPRGLATPMLDFDLHRTIMPAWGAKRDAPPNPKMVDLIQRLYLNFSIQISCAGINPATQDVPQYAIDRAAWQRRYLRQWGIPYDRLVSKDDCDAWGDDKSIPFTTPKQIETQINQWFPVPFDPVNRPVSY